MKTKAVGIAAMTIALLAYTVMSLLLVLPYGIAEPGSPDGDEFFAPFWAFGEFVWTWWVFIRPKYDHEISGGRRWLALAVVLSAAVTAAAWGLILQDRHEWDQAALYASLIATAGCRIGRYVLIRRALFGLLAPQGGS